MTGIMNENKTLFEFKKNDFFHRDKIDTTSSLNYLVCSTLICL